VRIESQGYTEVQPVYQHVGYTSAAYDAAYARPNAAVSPTWLLGLGMLMLALSLMTLRRRGMWARAAGTVLVASALFAGFAAVHASRQPKVTLIPEFYETLYHLESACRDTDRMVGELGRVPSEREWRAQMCGKPYALDGWAYPFAYEPSPRGQTLNIGGRQYRIFAAPERMTRTLGYTPTDHIVWDIGSESLGRDGVLGTQDDCRELAYHLRQAGWEPADRPAPSVPPEGR